MKDNKLKRDVMNKKLEQIAKATSKRNNTVVIAEYESGEKVEFNVNEIIYRATPQDDGETLYNLKLICTNKQHPMNKNNTCKTCQHWKNKQAELDYSTYDGICTCPKWRFETTNEADVCVLDRLNRSDRYKGDQRLETLITPQVGRIYSRYCLVTAHEFGCIHHVTDKQ